MSVDAEFIPLKWVLYGPGGLHPDLRIADVRRLKIRTIRRKGSHGRFFREYITPEQRDFLASQALINSILY